MLRAKNIVLTGGNDGIGYETVKSLYDEGHNVIFGSRNLQKNKKAFEEITKTKGGKIMHYHLDLAKKSSITDFASNVTKDFATIDILINNAGVFLTDREVSELGMEMTLTINHFGHFYLTYLLFDKIKQSKEGRILNLTSNAHFFANDNLFDDLDCQQSFSSYSQYANSKLFNVFFTVGLNDFLRKHKISNVRTVSLHPGIINTDITVSLCVVRWFKCCCGCCLLEREKGAACTLHLSRVDWQELASGQYYDADMKVKEMNKQGRDKELVEKLWRLSEKAYEIDFK